MIYLATKSLITLISCIAVGIAAITVLSLTVFKNFILKRNVRELNRNFEYLHAILFGQDAQFVKRLEIISRTNLLYVDIHLKFNKKYKEIKDILDPQTQAIINRLKEMVVSRKFKELQVELVNVKPSLSLYDDEVNNLNNDLVNIIKPEEDCRQASLTSKEKLRILKQDYFIKQTDLTLMSQSFDTLFANIEKCFAQFEKLVESAQYEESKALLLKVDQVIGEVSKVFPQLPSICTTITSIIPEKISLMNERYEEMLGHKYPLTHLMVKTAVEDMKKQLEYITDKIRQFSLNGVNEQLDGILSRIDEYIESFDGEESAKEIFDHECTEIYDKSSQIEKRYIKLCNILPEIKKVFILPELQQDNIAIIRDEINKTGATKRSLDTFIHSSTSQPYSVLVSKMRLLDEETNTSNKLLDEFFVFLNSLKTDSETALLEIEAHHKDLRAKEIAIRHSDIAILSEKYCPRIQEIYKTIDCCYSSLISTPIDVSKVNLLVEEFTKKTNELCSEIDQDLNEEKQAEQAIIYGNRDRMHLTDLHQLLKQTEELFFSGDFHTSLLETNKILQSIRSGDNDK